MVDKKRGNGKLIIILAAILVVSALLYFLFGMKEKPSTPTVVEDCRVIGDIYFRDACFMELAINEGNTDICNLISNQDQEDLCYLAISKIKNDTLICGLISDKGYLGAKCYNELE